VATAPDDGLDLLESTAPWLDAPLDEGLYPYVPRVRRNQVLWAGFSGQISTSWRSATSAQARQNERSNREPGGSVEGVHLERPRDVLPKLIGADLPVRKKQSPPRLPHESRPARKWPGTVISTSQPGPLAKRSGDVPSLHGRSV
jgi:hypothetical protein